MKRFLLVSLFILLYGLSAHANRPPVEYRGLRKKAEAELAQKFPRYKEGNLGLAELDEIVRYLMLQNLYSGVYIRRAGKNSNQLVLIAEGVRRIHRVQVVGNRRASDQEILNILNLKEGNLFHAKEIEISAHDLKSMYADRGFYSASIDIRPVSTSSGQLDLVVTVDEGPACEIESIVFRTPNKLLANRLNSLASGFRSDALSDEKLLEMRSAIQDFFTGHRYISARISQPAIDFNADKTKAKLYYSVEAPYRFEFLFDGNQFFTEGALIREFDLTKLSGSALNPAEELVQSIRETYLSRGFAHVEVTFREQTYEESFQHRIHFQIEEFPRARIRRFQIEGNYSRPASTYVDLLRKNSPDLIRAGYYRKEYIQESADLLIQELQNLGYLRARVLSIRPQFDKEKSYVTITINIDEGPLTQVQKITFSGNKVYSDYQLQKILHVEANKPLRLDHLEKSIADIKAHYRNHGYLEVEILNEETNLVQYNSNQTLADLHFQIAEGPQIKVGSIVVEGNTFTRSHVVTNELEFKKGDVITPEKLEDSVFRLQRMGIFSMVDITTLERGTDVSERTIVVKVSERDPGLFSLGVGLTNEQDLTYRGFLGLAYRNIDGTARAMSTRLDLRYATDPEIQNKKTFIENQVTFSYLEPYVFHERIRGRMTLLRSEQAVKNPNADEVDIFQTLEAKFLLEREFDKHVRATWNTYTISNLRTFDLESGAEERTTNIGTIGPLLELDFRNSLVNPTAGTLTRIDLEYSDPFLGSTNNSESVVQFVRSTFATTHYQPLGPTHRWVLVNSLRGGYLTNISDKPQSGVPSVKAFFLGGRSTIRGFNAQDSELVPNLAELNTENQDGFGLEDFYVRQDSYFYLVKSELRFPIYGNFGGVIFYDGGAVLLSDIDLADPYRDAAGLGFRFLTPVGAFSLDFGYKLDRKEKFGESDFAFHISIGTF